MQSLVPLRIIKLGGSLLNFNDLHEQFHNWFQTQTPARNLIVVGGGQAVEAIRDLDAVHCLPPNLTHWLSVELMSLTATLASKILGLEKPISTQRELNDFLTRPSATPAIACVQPPAYYTPSIAAQRNCQLPESWECTSDSISAWLASELAADQLVLLKSSETEFASTTSLSPEAILALAACDAVDPIFPVASQRLHDIRLINLRWRMLPACDQY